MVVKLHFLSGGVNGLLEMKPKLSSQCPVNSEILFNDADPAFVRPIMPAFRDNIVGERYLVAIHNSAVTTLYHVTLRGKESGFVSRTLAIIHARPTEYGLREDREPVIAILEHLDPGATEFIELFQIRYRAADEVFQDIHRLYWKLGRATQPRC